MTLVWIRIGGEDPVRWGIVTGGNDLLGAGSDGDDPLGG